MWYVYLNRDQQYLRSYRSHNLWLNIYHKKLRTPKIMAWHIAVLKRMSKSCSGVSAKSFIFQTTVPWHTSYLLANQCVCGWPGNDRDLNC